MPSRDGCGASLGVDVVSSAPAVPALYDSVVTHSRQAPLTHRFRYRTAYWLVDLDRLPQPSGPLKLLAHVRARDHLDVRALLRDSGVAADRVLMLTIRTLVGGYVFNPITVFWAYDRAGARTAVLAEVHNTYGGRHAYLLRPDGDGYAEVDKALYVSPFHPADGRYQIHVGEPGESVSFRVTLGTATATSHLWRPCEGDDGRSPPPTCYTQLSGIPAHVPVP